MPDTTPDLAKKPTSVRTVTGWTVFFMVLLRISIGWHFAYEGVWKLMQPDWRATSYLVQSTGPFRPLFRKLVWDVDGLQRLTPESMKSRIDEQFNVWVNHYDLKPPTDEQIAKMQDPKAKAAAEHKKSVYEQLVAFKEQKKSGGSKKDPNCVDAIWADSDFQEQLGDYKDLLKQISKREADLGGPDFNKERLVFDYGKKAQALKALLTRFEAPLYKQGPLDQSSLEGAMLAQLTQAQLANGPAPAEKSQTWWIDELNMWALTAVGVCLMLGLFTRLAALGGVALLALYYFSMPPFPWLPDNPAAEGHYLIINKNAIEAIALLMIAASRVGRWAGLDAWVSRLGGAPAARQETGT